jgi:hypothetical protein
MGEEYRSLSSSLYSFLHPLVRLRLKCDGTRTETRFRLSAKRTSPFKSAGTSVQSTTGSRGARISGSNAGYTMFRGSVKSTGYPLHSPVSSSFPLPCATVCHHISTGLYLVPLRSKYSQHPILRHPQPTFIPHCEQPSFTPIQNNRQKRNITYPKISQTVPRLICAKLTWKVWAG